jgi:hypothetical protein
MRRRYAYDGMRLCPMCNKYVYCDRRVGSCGEYTMESHLDNVCEANRKPCPKCNTLVNDGNLAVHLSEECVGNTIECPDCKLKCYAGQFESHQMFYCANKKR